MTRFAFLVIVTLASSAFAEEGLTNVVIGTATNAPATNIADYVFSPEVHSPEIHSAQVHEARVYSLGERVDVPPQSNPIQQQASDLEKNSGEETQKQENP